MIKVFLALAGLIHMVSAASEISSQIGTALGFANQGFCLAFQDNQDDMTTTCYAACSVTAQKLDDMMNPTKYSGGTINNGELATNVQNTAIQFLNQF